MQSTVPLLVTMLATGASAFGLHAGAALRPLANPRAQPVVALDYDEDFSEFGHDLALRVDVHLLAALEHQREVEVGALAVKVGDGRAKDVQLGAVARGLLCTIVRLINLVVDGSQYFGGNVAFCLPSATFSLEKLDI